MQIQPIEPNKRMTGTLTAQQWDHVMFVLHKHPMPYEVAAPIINSLVAELQQQAMASNNEISNLPQPGITGIPGLGGADG